MLWFSRWPYTVLTNKTGKLSPSGNYSGVRLTVVAHSGEHHKTVLGEVNYQTRNCFKYLTRVRQSYARIDFEYAISKRLRACSHIFAVRAQGLVEICRWVYVIGDVHSKRNNWKGVVLRRIIVANRGKISTAM